MASGGCPFDFLNGYLYTNDRFHNFFLREVKRKSEMSMHVVPYSDMHLQLVLHTIAPLGILTAQDNADV